MEQKPSGLWYKASAKNVAMFALMWLGEGFLILMFVKWVIHGSAAVYLLLVPLMLFGFDNGSAPELDSGRDASGRKSIRRRWSAIRETTATRFSLDD